jgi:arylsulfatase A-like enzyme
MDQFRADLLAGSELAAVASLPRLRALEKESVSFSKHYSVTSPCGPSRASLFTGQYAMNHRAVRNGTPLRHDTPNLAQTARKHGYIPKLFGYTDTAQDPRVLQPGDPRLESYEELMGGFDEVVRMRQDSDDTEWREHLAAKGTPLPAGHDAYRPNGDQLSDPALYSAQDSDTAFLTDRFLEEMGGMEPGWFGVLTYVRPHPPLVAPAPYNKMYDPQAMPAASTTLAPEGDRSWHPFLAPTQDQQSASSMVRGFPDLEPSEQTTSELRALYLGLASEVDHHIGRVVDWLKSSGQWDDTLVVVTGDHGEMLGDFGLWGKRSFHDASFHVPLMIRDPFRSEMHGRTVDGMTESIDIAVTILDWLDAKIPDSMNGTSLLRQLENTSAPAKAVTVSEVDFGNPFLPTIWMQQLGVTSQVANFAVLRTDRHRLVEFGCDLPSILFDMNADGEMRDISGQPDEMPILLDLTRKMLCHRMVNPEGTFARTVIEDGGVKVGDH